MRIMVPANSAHSSPTYEFLAIEISRLRFHRTGSGTDARKHCDRGQRDAFDMVERMLRTSD